MTKCIHCDATVLSSALAVPPAVGGEALEEAREYVRNLWRSKALREREHYDLIAILDKAEKSFAAPPPPPLRGRESLLAKAAQDFIDKVDRGAARSEQSYAAFKAALASSPEQPAASSAVAQCAPTVTDEMVVAASKALMNTFIKKWFLGSYKGPVYLDCVNGEKSWEDEARAALTAALTSTERWTAQDIAEAKAEAKELHNYFHPDGTSADGGGK